jgi:hypothetical protein
MKAWSGSTTEVAESAEVEKPETITAASVARPDRLASSATSVVDLPLPYSRFMPQRLLQDSP